MRFGWTYGIDGAAKIMLALNPCFKFIKDASNACETMGSSSCAVRRQARAAYSCALELRGHSPEF
jgi:hypothetical protein